MRGVLQGLAGAISPSPYSAPFPSLPFHPPHPQGLTIRDQDQDEIFEDAIGDIRNNEKLLIADDVDENSIEVDKVFNSGEYALMGITDKIFGKVTF